MSLYKLAFLAACGFSALYLMVGWNRYLSLRARVRWAFFSIEAQLQRRYGLIPRLAQHIGELLSRLPEEPTDLHDALQRVLYCRDRAMVAAESVNSCPVDGASMHRLLIAETALGSELGLLLGIAEQEGLTIDHPLLERLAESLADAEHHIACQRADFDAAVDRFNRFVELFPNRLLRLQRAAHFGIELSSARAPVHIFYT